MIVKNLARLLFVLLIAAVVVSAQDYPPSPPPSPAAEDAAIGSLGVQLVSQFLTSDFVKRKVQLLFDVLDLKTRLIHAVVSFCTTENLIALRRFLDWICRLAKFLDQYLPTVPEENPQVALLALMASMFNNFVSPAPTEAPFTLEDHQNDYTPPPPLIYSPPSFYESPQLNETTPELSANVKRSLDEKETKETEQKQSDLSEDEIRTMLKNKNGVLTLSKLISTSKR